MTLVEPSRLQSALPALYHVLFVSLTFGVVLGTTVWTLGLSAVASAAPNGMRLGLSPGKGLLD